MLKSLIILALGINCFAAELTPKELNSVASAIYFSEGGNKIRHPYGIRYYNRNQRELARNACIKIVQEEYEKWQVTKNTNEFINFLAQRYCPINDRKDVRHLNQFWPKNVKSILGADFILTINNRLP